MSKCTPKVTARFHQFTNIDPFFSLIFLIYPIGIPQWLFIGRVGTRIVLRLMFPSISKFVGVFSKFKGKSQIIGKNLRGNPVAAYICYHC